MEEPGLLGIQQTGPRPRGVTHQAVALAVAGLLTAACGSTPDEDASPPPETAGSPATPSAGTASPPEDGAATLSDESEDPAGDPKIVGAAESVDDVGKQDRTPMTDRTLLMLPQAKANRLWDLIEHVPSDSELPYVGGLLEPADLEPWHLAPIHVGRFELDVPDGDYLVCLLSGEFILNGCADATVAGATTWDVAHGEGGFELTQ